MSWMSNMMGVKNAVTNATRPNFHLPTATMATAHDGPLLFKGEKWSQLLDPQAFKWTPGVTPFSSLTLFMRNRPPFALRKATAIHNLFLCGASAAICAGVVRQVYRRATRRGVDEIFCTADPDSLAGPLSWYLYLYYLTKFYELADTFILILKKVGLTEHRIDV
ncbi:hypothetical protein HDU86_005327 [Geranomyces michiganensis]|nr:hypothetical protein HDU86_005327 [Geranomyces michiganensis]